MRKVLTKALIFKPKKLIDGWEHKKGFYVSIAAESALAAIDNARENKRYSKSFNPDIYTQLSKEKLRFLAESRLFEIESSKNNYIELICLIGGLGILVYLSDLLFVIWNYPNQNSVRLFLILATILGVLIFVFSTKMKIDKYLVDDFLEVEDALYTIEYGESQYQYRR